MKKSSLKTFLAGKNPLISSAHRLRGSREMCHACDGTWFADEMWADTDKTLSIDGCYEFVWVVDVLGDGTAITYCMR